MRVRYVLVTLLIMFGLTVPVMGQGTLTNFNFLGDGARAKAMGGAFISIADDGSALSWNPAGLIQVLDPQVSLAFDFFRPKSTFNVNYSANSDRNLSDPISDNKFPMSFASFTAPIRIKGHQFVASASFGVLSTRYEDFLIRVGIEDVESPFTFYEDYDNRLNNLRLGFGTNVYKNLNFGAGIDIYIGDGVSNLGYDYLDSMIIQEQDVEFVYKSGRVDSISYSGVNFVGGLQWVGDKFRLASVVKTPFFLTQKHVVHYADTSWINGVSSTSSGFIDELQKEKIQIPWGVDFGASYELSEKFLLSGDVGWRRYGSAVGRIHFDTTLSNGDIDEQFYENNLAMENGYQLRFGGEYKIATSFATIPIRAGFRLETFGWLEQIDADYGYGGEEEEEVTDTIVVLDSRGDQRTGYSITFGTGLHWKLIRLDIAFEYDVQDNNSNGTDIYGPFTSVVEYRGTRISFNFSGLFK
jgi:long-chain fatty acid transport protein